jgi:Mg2+-importing ATPase
MQRAHATTAAPTRPVRRRGSRGRARVHHAPAAAAPAEAGLTSQAAAARLRLHGPNTVGRLPARRWRAGLRRLANPLVAVLLFAGAVAAVTGQAFSAAMIGIIVGLSLLVDAWQERRADRSADALASRIAPTAVVLRDGRERVLPVAVLVPGDVVRLAAGSLVPANGRLLASQQLFVQQALLTGETFPVEKRAGAAGDAGSVSMGTSVVSGTATMLVARTGGDTRMGRMAGLLRGDRSDIALERDLRRFGLLVLRLATALVLLVLLANAWMGRPWLESFLFALALAVGITPELLPMVVSASLARGAMRLAAQHVIVRHPAAIHSLGSMDVLCTDKTGTLTEARIRTCSKP